MDQLIQFARCVGLETSLAPYSLFEDLLLKARLGRVAQCVTSRYPDGRSLFPSVAGCKLGDSVASLSVYLLLSITKTDASSVAVSGEVFQEPYSSRQADARLVEGHSISENPRTDSPKNLQQVKLIEKKKKSRTWNWSRKGSLKPLLPSSDDKLVTCSQRKN